MLYVLSQLAEGLLLVAALYWTGDRLLSIGGWQRAATAAEHAVTAVSVAVGALSGLLFLLASVGLYRRVVLLLLLVVPLLGMARLVLQSVRGRFRPGADSKGDGVNRSWSTVSGTEPRAPALVLRAALLLCAIVLLVQALRPDVVWDAAVYHLTLPKIFLEHGGFTSPALNVYAHWPLAVQLLYGVALALGSSVPANLMHLAFGLLAAVAVALIARRSRAAPRHWAGLLAAVLFLANPVVLLEIRIAYVDLAWALLFAASFLALDSALGTRGHNADGRALPTRPRVARFLPSGERGRSLLLAGVLAGIAATVKLSGFFVLVSLGVVWALEIVRSRGDATDARSAPRDPVLVQAIWLFLPTVLCLVPWAIKNLIFTGNPVYPLLYPVFGGAHWSEALASQHAQWQTAMGMGREPIDWLLLPFRVIWSGDFGYASFDGQISRAWVVLLPLALISSWRDRTSQRALVAAFVFFVLWAVSSQQMRFLIPILPLLAGAAARGASTLVERLPVRLASAAPLGAALAAVFMLASPLLRYAPQTRPLLRDLVRFGADLEQRAAHPVYGWVNQSLPENARLLLINTNDGYWLERDFLADSFFEASQVREFLGPERDRAEVDAFLRDNGVTHVLVENVERGLVFSEYFVALLSDPARARTIYQSPDDRFTLIEVLQSDPSVLAQRPDDDHSSTM